MMKIRGVTFCTVFCYEIILLWKYINSHGINSDFSDIILLNYQNNITTYLTPKYWPSTKSWGTSSRSSLSPCDWDFANFPVLIFIEDDELDEIDFNPFAALIRSLSSTWCRLHIKMSRSSTLISKVRRICRTFWHRAKWSRTTPNVVTYMTIFPFSVSAKLWNRENMELQSIHI